MIPLSIHTILNIGSFGLLVIGLAIIFTKRNLITMVIGLNVADVGANILLVNAGFVKDGTAPIFTTAVGSAQAMSDPVPQALVLTSIVIGFGITALALALIVKLYRRRTTLDVSKIRGLKW
ncbi:MAG TPA: cation:proton antiporter [Sediminispirochaeta sp.]|nr:cation:proton antiporter [Sediminispirochaeta sp.]